jgi:integrase
MSLGDTSGPVLTLAVTMGGGKVKGEIAPLIGQAVTLGDVLDRLASHASLSDTRKRDLRSAVTTYAKLARFDPAAIPLDLGEMRQTLDGVEPAALTISRKRWANLRSDLAAAIHASGLRPILRTGKEEPSGAWTALLQSMANERARTGLSRFARWATRHQITPERVDDAIIQRFIAELETSSLVRKVHEQHRMVTRTWNLLVRLRPDTQLRMAQVPLSKFVPTRISWDVLPSSFREDVERHLAWCAMPDPLDETARVRALAPQTRILRQNQIHSAVTAAAGTGRDVGGLTSLASLCDVKMFRDLLRHRWAADGNKLTAHTHGIAGTLIAIASEWVHASPADVAELKRLRGRLGSLPSGLTEKNRTLLRKCDDPLLLGRLVDLPDLLWFRARRHLVRRKGWAFVHLQNALAIDFLLHVPVRMENLIALHFEKHLHWAQGPGKPALVTFSEAETKNRKRLEFEIPAVLADRFLFYRDRVYPEILGVRPGAVFVHSTGERRTQAALTVAIEKAVLRNVGVVLTPHQFRHLAAKIILDANPGAFEHVRQLLGHEHYKTTTNYYAGVDTRRAGRAHADLLMKLRERMTSRRPRRRSVRGAA